MDVTPDKDQILIKLEEIPRERQQECDERVREGGI